MKCTRRSIVAPVLALLGALAACSDDDTSPNQVINGSAEAGASSSGHASSGGTNPEGGAAVAHKPSPLPSHASSIALSPDDTRAVVANREAGTASIFSIDWSAGAPVLTKTAEIAVGGEVSSVAMHPSGSFALALSRVDQKLVRIDDLAGTPKIGATLATGSEPTGVAMTPMGDTAWVANWVDGTVMVVDTSTFETKQTIDLNAALAASGLVGDVTARPSLSHPRSIAITNNGNNLDNDESVWVTEFYAQQKTPLAPDGSNADTAKVGVVYRISVKDPADIKVVELPAMADMGFKDHKNGVAGCFPNQLLSINIQGSFGYVTSICASPKGPVGPFTGPAAAVCTLDTDCPGGLTGSCASGKCTTNCTTDAQCGANGGVCNPTTFVCNGNIANIKTTVAPAVSIIDLGGASTIATVNLAREFETSFDQRALANDGNRRMPLTPMDVGFVPGTVTAYFAAKGADAVFKVDFNATYEASTIDGVADPKAPFINLSPAGVDASRIGRLPTGIAIAFKTHTAPNGEAGGKRFAFVNSENTRNVAVLDLEAQDLDGRATGTPNVIASADLPTDAKEKMELEGERLFATGLGRWSFKGQGWAACESCHVDGMSDNVTWFFPKGARQPNSLDALFDSKDPTKMRLQNWTAVQDEVSDHEMGAIRGTMGGVGAIVKNGALDNTNRIAIDKLGQAGLAGSSLMAADPTNPAKLPDASVLDDWAQVNGWFKTIRSPKRPTNLDATKVAAGKALFQEGNCQGCHGGSQWTLSNVFYTPDPTNVVNLGLKAKSWTTTVTNAGFPSTLLAAITPASQTMRYNGTNGALDSITCVLRPVGTFNLSESAVGVAELRQDMVTPSTGNDADNKGFNPPSLLSMTVGAPYFHAGQARTLEASLGSPFDVHREALKAGFLAASTPDRAAKVEALVQFLLSIDEGADAIPLPPLGPTGGTFCAP
jgi:mono/diheme cytochrome c family protein/DNA-binding beta-propeller fold protein YncE